MKISDVLVQLDHIKPNQYDDAALVRWLSTLDGYLYHEVLCWHEKPEEEPGGPLTEEPVLGAWDVSVLPYDADTDKDKQLLVPAPYDDIYVKYLCAQIDFHNAEWTRYNNSMILYNTALSAYADWLNRNNRPKQEHYVRI